MKNPRKISVIGLGYVGLPVAVAFARAGQKVIAFDINTARIDELKNGHDRTNEVDDRELKLENLHITNDPADLKQADFHIVTVPTPINAVKRPDLGAVFAASRTVAKALKKGDIVVYESTVYPGVTEEECMPILEEISGLKGGVDFFVGYSPERINPGDKQNRFETITKVVSGQDAQTLAIVSAVYGSVVTAGIHEAPTIKVAEAAKVIENTQRDLNIAFMNELALIFDRLHIDTNDVLEAAGTKWNFLKFSPGLVGGHCIGVDPFYLTHRAEQVGYYPSILLAGRRVNDRMGHFVAGETVKYLTRSGASREAIVTILGCTFKENVPDIRNSRVLDIASELKDYGFKIQILDPHATPAEVMEEYGETIFTDIADLKPAHAVVLAVPHKDFLDQGWSLMTKCLLNQQGFVFDIKACLPRSNIPAGIELKRL